MNLRQQKYKKNRIELGMKPEMAAVAAGYSRSYARAKAYAIDNALSIGNVGSNIGMAEQLELVGLTDKTLAQHAKDGLEATHTVTDAEGNAYETPDWASRHRYFRTILEVTKRISSKHNTVVDNSKHTHINVGKMDINDRINLVVGVIDEQTMRRPIEAASDNIV